MNGDVDEDFHMFNGIGPRGTKRVASPTLPLSPVSNQSSPSRKRIRLQRGWDPPSHVPDFLPPFPSSSSELEVNPLQSPQVKTEMEVILPPSSGAYDRERERQPTPPPQHLSMATSAADYLTPVPYNMSSLSSVSEAHLPEPSLRTASTSAGTALQLLPRKRDPPPIVQSIYTAYHHVLTQRPSSEPSTNTGRHRVALTMLDQAYARPRWTAPDTLFANLAASRPRIVSPAPTFPIFLGSALGREDKHLVIPSTLRTLMVDETVFPLSHQPTSRIPNIAQAILPVYHIFVPPLMISDLSSICSTACSPVQHGYNRHRLSKIRKRRKGCYMVLVCQRHGTQTYRLQMPGRAGKTGKVVRAPMAKAGSATRRRTHLKMLDYSRHGTGRRMTRACHCRQVGVDGRRQMVWIVTRLGR